MPAHQLAVVIRNDYVLDEILDSSSVGGLLLHRQVLEHLILNSTYTHLHLALLWREHIR